jgi:hypothetical protein
LIKKPFDQVKGGGLLRLLRYERSKVIAATIEKKESNQNKEVE